MKTIIITGGSSGIGKAATEIFAKKGYMVYELSRHGKNAEGITHIDCDVTNGEQCKNAAQTVFEQQGRIDLLISNAGIGISGAVEFTEADEARRQFDVNFFGAFNIVQAVIPYMRQQRRGRIIFVSSLIAAFSVPFQAFYGATKSAVNSLALALRNELRPFGIGVCVLMPGDVKTGFTAARKKSFAGSDIYTHMEKAVSTMEHDEQNGPMPERMARRLFSMAETKHPSALSTVGWKHKLLLFLAKQLPPTFIFKVVGRLY